MQIIKSFQVFENGDARFGMGFEGAFHQQFAFEAQQQLVKPRIPQGRLDRLLQVLALAW
jgi:hypothetical protein